MTSVKQYLVAAVALLMVLVGCSPKSVPLSAQAPATPTLAPVVPTLSPALTSGQDGAWTRVVQEARKEGHVTVYASAYFDGDKGQIVAKAFEDSYGIRPEFLIVTGPQTVEKIKVEASMKQPICDIVASGESTTSQLSQAGMTASVSQELPELRDKSVFVSEPVFSPNGDMISFSLKINGPVVNTNFVKPQDQPRSYFDLLQPKWKGKVILEDPRTGGGAGFTWFSALYYYKVLDADYFRRFANQEPILWGGGFAEEMSMVARGEAWLAPHAADSTVGYMIVEGAPLRLIGIKEGNIATSDIMTVVKGAAHPNAARLFINWILSKEGQQVYARAGSLESMRKDVTGFLDPRVKMQPAPEKLLPRTYDMAAITNQYHKDRLAESMFGKK